MLKTTVSDEKKIFFKKIFYSSFAESQHTIDLEASAVDTTEACYHGYQVGRFLLYKNSLQNVQSDLMKLLLS